MAPTAPTEPGERLILALTRACNLRCGFCPVELGTVSMSEELARRAVAVYLARVPAAPAIRFFGGEPLLRFPVLRAIVDSFRPRRAGSPRFSFPTNGTLLDRRVLAFLRRRPEVEVSVSRVRSPRALARLPNLLVSVCVPPGGAGKLPGHLARLLRAGFTRLNLLPAFFVRWRARELAELSRALRLSAALVRAWRARGARIELRNAAVREPGPLFNHGMVVDADGSVYSSNAALCAPLARLRPALRLGSVLEPARIAWGRAAAIDWDAAFAECFPAAALASTRRVDALLTDFVERAA